MGIWVPPYAIPLHVQVGGFRENGVWPSLYDVAVSWLRLQTPIGCITHLYWRMYTKCFSFLLRCCGWAYHGYTLMLEYIVQALIMDITTYLVMLHQLKEYNNYFKACSGAQHLIPFQNSRGIITDRVVGSRGQLLGREPSLRSSIATLFCIPCLRHMKNPVWLNSSRY
jgi:hypothetical protein